MTGWTMPFTWASPLYPEIHETGVSPRKGCSLPCRAAPAPHRSAILTQVTAGARPSEEAGEE